jgi:streptogramin lyase
MVSKPLKMVHVSASGKVGAFDLPKGLFAPGAIAVGGDGNLWVADEGSAGGFWKVTPKGACTHFPDTTIQASWLALGADGNVWFTDAFGKSIGYVTQQGAISTFALPSGDSAGEIIAGPDGNMWMPVGSDTTNSIDQVSLTGTILNSFTVPGPLGLNRIAVGSDGNIWFTGYQEVGKMTTSGTFTTYPTPLSLSFGLLSLGADGNLWALTYNNSDYEVLRIQPDGTLTLFPGRSPRTLQFALGPDGNVWFAVYESQSLGRISTPALGAVVLAEDPGFFPSKLTISLGSKVEWVFLGPNAHSASDTSGMGAYDSGSMNPGSIYVQTFGQAGSWPYRSTVGSDTISGSVVVPVSVPKTARLGNTFTVQWAGKSPSPGTVFTVQVQMPGSTNWHTWDSATSAQSARYKVTSLGVYRFRALTSNASGSSKYSPAASVKVS